MILALFFTRGVSLETWVDTGLFDREKLIYEGHLKRGHLKTVYWLTYGSRDAELSKNLHAEKRLHPGIQAIAMPGIFKGKIGKLIYSFLMPLLQKTCLNQSDIYKTNQMDGSWSAVLAKWLYHRPLIVRTGYTLSIFARKRKSRKIRIFIYQLMERLAYKNGTCAIVTTRQDEKYVSDKYRCPPEKIVIIPNCIDTNLFKPEKREKYSDRIIFVGRLSEQKNLFNLISAIAKTDLLLDIYGNGELREALERHAKSEGARVKLMGTVPNKKLPEILNRYKYYILPSYFEGMPKTLLEAMACGLACIGTDVEGINEVIEDGVNGVLCDTDSSDILGAISALMENPERRERLGNAAREYVIGHCSVSDAVQKELLLYEQIAA